MLQGIIIRRIRLIGRVIKSLQHQPHRTSASSGSSADWRLGCEPPASSASDASLSEESSLQGGQEASSGRGR